jgi:LytR cell envelope-related transcriptional attenuator
VTRQHAPRNRWELLGGIGLAALGVAILIVALIALHNPNGHSSVASQDTSTPKSSLKSSLKSSPRSSPAKTKVSASGATSTSVSSPAAADETPLVVLNDTFRVGLAGQAMRRFEAGGWAVTSIGNFTDDIPSTSAYFDPAVPGAEAAARALQVQFPTIKRVAPKLADLPAGPVVVVLRADYS